MGQIPRSTERISSFLCNKIHIKIVLQYKLFTNAHYIQLQRLAAILEGPSFSGPAFSGPAFSAPPI